MVSLRLSWSADTAGVQTTLETKKNACACVFNENSGEGARWMGVQGHDDGRNLCSSDADDFRFLLAFRANLLVDLRYCTSVLAVSPRFNGCRAAESTLLGTPATSCVSVGLLFATFNLGTNVHTSTKYITAAHVSCRGDGVYVCMTSAAGGVVADCIAPEQDSSRSNVLPSS